MRRIQPLLLTALLLSFSGLLSPWVEADGPKARYILTGPDTMELKDLVHHNGGKIVAHLKYHSGWIIELDSTQAFQIRATLAMRSVTQAFDSHSAPQAEERLERDGEVHLIDSAKPVIVSTDQSLRKMQKTPWGVRAIHAPEAFSIARGKSVTVCIVDTGIQKDHPDLEGAVAGGENTIPHSTNYPDLGGDRDWDDDNGHGTHVSGTIAARDNSIGVVGVAPEAKIYAVKSLDARGSGTYSAVAEGIRSCINHNAQIINMSLGTSPTDDSDIIRNAVNDALHAGIIVVAAAGNERGAVDFPANIPGVVAVSALTTDQHLAYFSNRGPEVSFIAPGEEILSTFPRNSYAIMQGTSQASPHVAGVAALLLSAGAQAHDVKSLLRGDDLGLSQNAQGAGCIDAYESLKNFDSIL